MIMWLSLKEESDSVTGDKDIGIDTMQWRLDTLGRHWIDR